MKSLNTALSRVPNDIFFIECKQEMGEVKNLRNEQFKRYPEGGSAIDKFDKDACILASKNNKGKITSTGRIVFDGGLGLPADRYVKSEIDKLRNQGFIIAELSKFAIASEARGILRGYLRAYYEIAAEVGIDFFISINPCKDVGVYKKIYAATVRVEDIGHSYGTSDKFTLLEFDLKKVRPCLSRWLKEELS